VIDDKFVDELKRICGGEMILGAENNVIYSTIPSLPEGITENAGMIKVKDV